MTFANTDQHTYERSFDAGTRNSLSAICEFVPVGSVVLDVGTGSGALGRHLAATRQCVVDGVTYNAEEAALAAPHYRDVFVVDLESVPLGEACGERRYDCIVCADVLEHLRSPGRVLDDCRTLLEGGGRLLISVPNVGYLGLLAELLEGDFKYRVEGLLDETHLRFFTRRSLVRMLEDAGWGVEALETIDLSLADSEFRPLFERLPPAVRDHLLSLPDGRAYQFIACATPGGDTAAPLREGSVGNRPLAHFSCQLYVDHGSGFDESRKIVARGLIGEERQTISFAIPAEGGDIAGLRLDPADRPGLLRLYAMRARSPDTQGSILWEWDGRVASLGARAAHQVGFSRLPGESRGALLLLAGDDPHFELPVAPEVLSSANRVATLEVELSWPMSTDASLFAERFADQEILHERLRQTLAQAEERAASLEADLGATRAELEHATRTLAETASLQARLADAERALGDKSAQLGQLGRDLATQQQRCAQLSGDLRELGLRAETAQRERDSLVDYLKGIENSTVFRATRPLVKAKMALDRLLSRGPARPADAGPERPLPPPDHPVDVIVPVYRGLEDTRCCIESVLASEVAAPYRLIVINDASPEPEVGEWLRQAAHADERILLLENEENLGFVATVNRGMSLSESNDVVLLNSDAEVANDWLDRLRACAYRAEHIATVTPFSNNATICSYPRFCEDNELPGGHDTASLDHVFAEANAGRAVDIPTGIGFCMYIRRACLDEVGLFDVERFGKGYGEENDFCMRARRRGWRHLFALDTFVRHAGGVSFAEDKSPREREAQAVLQRLHPRYESMVHQHIAADPARPARLAVDLARVRRRALPAILFVTHDRGGGTLRHVHELAALLAEASSAYILSPAPGGEVRLELFGAGETFALHFLLPGEIEFLVQTLLALGISHVHYHHLLGHSPEIFGLPRRLGVEFDYTAHDFYALCPQITLTDHRNRYCGELGVQQCAACLQRMPAPGGVSIETWRSGYRELLGRARWVFAPSHDAARRIGRLAPEAHLRVIPHADLDGRHCASPAPQPRPGEHVLRIAVIGALSIIKGADVLEAVAVEAARRQLPIEFHLIGFAYRSLKVQPRAHLTVHGEYREEDLPGLLDWLEPDLVWFPALWPETYSYTLSACLDAALPIVAPDLGAFRERLAGRPWSWIQPWDQPTGAWIDFFIRIQAENFTPGHAPEPTVAGAGGEAPGFSYADDYMKGIPARELSTEIDVAALAGLRPGRRGGLHGARSGLKQGALRGLVRLRSAPLLRGLSRRIPLRWQTRLKTWLLN